MTKLAFAFALLASASIARADAPEHVINDAAQTVTVDCGDGGKVVVNGSSNNVTVTGGCAKVAVNGSANNVAIDAADKIAVTGSGNHVTYKKGFTKKSPKVARTGVGNKVSRAK
ncbi:MAG: DUF3060 domain-containing protein [Myxococcales bacterium]|nr:DUF3060 domain-containing protein [Myxococcales bacterium]